MDVLVGYASEHGSTREIAEQLTSRLRGCGYRVDLRPMAEVDDPGDYDAVVLGSAIHGGAWLQEATAFMAHSLGALAGRPVWLFSVGMSGALPRPMQSLASRYEPKEIAGYRQAIAVAGHQLFSGVIRPEHWDRRARRRFRLLGCRYGDYRDWDAIDAWADQIVERLAGVEAGAQRS